MRRTTRILERAIAGAACVLMFSGARPSPSVQPEPYRLTKEADAFLEDLSKRSFMFFWEQADAKTGLVRDRSRTDGAPASPGHRSIGSIASTGFGLTGLCIAAERGWLPREQLVARARVTLTFFAEKAYQNHGWFYHWLNIETGEREWKSEVSSIDTALLMGGVLSVRQCFKDDATIVKHADAIFARLDFKWMLNGHETLLSHGWHPETGFIEHRWAEFSEAMILYILGLGSPTPAHALPAASWAAWSRPRLTYGPYTYVTTVPPLFLHQYSHAWVDFRGWRDPVPPQPDWFANSVIATRAAKRFALDLAKSGEFPGYSENIWGITASDTRKGYKAWGGPPRDPDIDGTVVPCAAAGSLMIAPDITVPAVIEIHRRFGDRIYGKYGFADAFHPVDGWVNPDVIGIDLGITLLSAENLRTGRVWQWFMANGAIPNAMRRAGMTPATPELYNRPLDHGR